MRRFFTVLLVTWLITWLEFAFIPGHTYLASRSQLYLPILQRLATPGFLSRDLVATHPNVTFTGYDEITLFLTEAIKLDFRRALLVQQFLCRFAGVVGIYLLARSTGLKTLFSLITSATVNLGALLPGLDIPLFDTEPVPRAFAFGLTLLAAGLLSDAKPLLAGLFGGIALLYDPVMAAPFWIASLLAFLFDAKLRRLIRPCLPILLVFILLLGNLAQLQPGGAEMPAVFSRLLPETIRIEQFRTPGLWLSLWPSKVVYLYLGIAVFAVWALTAIWPSLNRQTRWLAAALPLTGLLSLPFSYFFLEHLRWSFIPRIHPIETIAFTVAIAWIACLIAGFKALEQNVRLDSTAWFAVCLLLIVFRTRPPVSTGSREVLELAAWAEARTWGSSLFAFPDAGRAAYPGIFRAKSRRGLWVDWQSGAQTNAFASLAPDWWERWQQSGDAAFSGTTVENMLGLPIDYYVLKRTDLLESKRDSLRGQGIKAVYANGEFVVYDAGDLRAAPGHIRLVARNRNSRIRAGSVSVPMIGRGTAP